MAGRWRKRVSSQGYRTLVATLLEYHPRHVTIIFDTGRVSITVDFHTDPTKRVFTDSEYEYVYALAGLL